MVICGELKLNSCDDRTLSLVVASSITAATFTMSSPARTDSYAEAGMLSRSFRTAGRAQVMWNTDMTTLTDQIRSKMQRHAAVTVNKSFVSLI